MRNALTRRTSAIAVAGVLALAGAACGDDGEDTGTDVEITQEETTQPANETTIEEQTTVESTEDMGTSTEMSTSTEMGTETTG